MLAGIYGWFTEGFDTADLKDAKALLDELNQNQGVVELPSLARAEKWQAALVPGCESPAPFGAGLDDCQLGLGGNSQRVRRARRQPPAPDGFWAPRRRSAL